MGCSGRTPRCPWHASAGSEWVGVGGVGGVNVCVGTGHLEVLMWARALGGIDTGTRTPKSVPAPHTGLAVICSMVSGCLMGMPSLQMRCDCNEEKSVALACKIMFCVFKYKAWEVMRLGLGLGLAVYAAFPRRGPRRSRRPGRISHS